MFKIGDVVEFGGEEGAVSDIHTSKNNSYFPIEVKFKSFSTLFTAKGHYLIGHTKPLLNFVSRSEEYITVDGIKYKRVES
jgi:hypothetical protein